LDLYTKIDADIDQGITTEEPIGEEIQNTGDYAEATPY
jgi:hypothetical protein